MDTLQARFRAGDINFETAAVEALGATAQQTRNVLADALDEIAHAVQPVAQIGAQSAALYDAAGFAERPDAFGVAIDRAVAMDLLTRSALTVNLAAARLGVTTGRVRQRVSDRSLWAFKANNRILLPSEQFIGDSLIPGIDKVIPATSKDLPPLSMLGLLTTAQEGLLVDGQQVSIVDWLAGGGDTASALEIVDAHTWSA